MIYLTLHVCFLRSFYRAVIRGVGCACGIEECTVRREYFTSCYCLHQKRFLLDFLKILEIIISIHGSHAGRGWLFDFNRTAVSPSSQIRLCGLWNVNLPVTDAAAAVS